MAKKRTRLRAFGLILTIAICLALLRLLPQQLPYRRSLPERNDLPTAPPSPSVVKGDRLTVMSWNVENLFDTQDDPATDDEEFTPRGSRRWTEHHLERKLSNITDIIRRTEEGRGPDLIALMEVETLAVLRQVASHPNVKSLGYQYVYLQDGQDPRGIDVGLVSRYPAQVRYHRAYFGSRYILEAVVAVQGKPFHLLVNHWRSRLGGRETTQERRIMSAKTCRRIVERIWSENPQAAIAIVGDFNDTAYDVSLRKHLRAQFYGNPLPSGDLFNLEGDLIEQDRKGIDQMIISSGAIRGNQFSYIVGTAHFIRWPFMLTRSGWPLSYQSAHGVGYSDHLPLVASFAVAK